MYRIRLLPALILVASLVLALKIIELSKVSSPSHAQFLGVVQSSAQDTQDPMAPAEGADQVPENTEILSAPAPDGSLREETVRGSELDVLNSLRARRERLAEEAEELQLRETLLNATEQRIEARIAELEALEQRLIAAAEAEVQARKEELGALVTMYETMKPKDAARIFDRLPMDVLVHMVEAMNPRRMSAILAQMTPDVAQKLTGELTRRSGATRPEDPMMALPQIGG